MRKILASAPLLLPAIAMTAGIITAYCVGTLTVVGATLVLGTIMLLAKQRYGSILAFSAAFGSLCLFMSVSSQATLPLEKPITVRADILEAKETESGQSLIAEIKSVRAPGQNFFTDVAPTKVALSVSSANPSIESGHEISASLKLQRPVTRIFVPAQFDYGGSLKMKNINYSAYVVMDSIKSYTDAPGAVMAFKRARNRLSTYILRSDLEPSAKIFLNTVLTGDTEYLDEDTRSYFSSSGLAHILALSGLHVGIISTILFMLLYPFRLTGLRPLSPIIVILCLWLFALLTGLSPSVTRAVVMATVFLLAFMLQRRHNPFNSLALAAILILTFDPLAVFNISFQLSFLAVIGILVFAERLNPVDRSRKPLYYLAASLCVAISAMTFAGVVSAYHFHSFPIFFLLANVLTFPLVPVFIFLGIIYLTLSALGLELTWMKAAIDWIFYAINGISEYFSLPKDSIFNRIYFDLPVLVFLLLFIGSLAVAIHLRRRSSLLASGAIAACLILLVASSGKADDERIYIVPSSSRTDILIPDQETLNIVTTAPLSEHSSVAQNAQKMYADFIKSKSISKIEVASALPDRASGSSFVLEYAGGKMAICSSDEQLNSLDPSEHYVYLLLTAGYKGDIENISENFAVDTFIISSDIHIKRHNRFVDACRKLNQPVISLREEMPPSLHKKS